MIELTVGLGVLISLVFHEVFGAAAGGIVVPGYIAMHLNQPLRLVGTVLVAFVAYLAIRVISRFVFVYGRRRLVMAILLGFIFGYLSRETDSGTLFRWSRRTGFGVPRKSTLRVWRLR